MKKRKQQAIQDASQFFGAELDAPAIEPSWSRRPLIVYLYLCPQCGWWDISNGIGEVFGDLYHHAGPRTEPCERCHYAPMYLMKRDDLLHVVIESEKEQTAHE